ncbi:MAG: lipopolysaccharide assembly protein LapA domain-containing protein [Bacteroidales bacterium]|jgi:uncharacterized integral membrane protein|nr:lipopolysaccharide assembly protein LapA domain-containing protein [Bacteroidales bacterium]MDD2571486.1 lipopolysaccharide assembly protein LapA domain-containing protein [Bacteroidales bacterium]MDD2812492.1 lipopolysaccharide assembly protein LapA domain-containing protein [Bacteroidales bacterium]MDD3385542.1 lipopolysaccharide assembly protein LapA domain-containing protein [Bacteroidales bacterium]MDD3811995.1 lipopolysaccharide assembly protein LapA domain-containing protein [Bacteroi
MNKSVEKFRITARQVIDIVLLVVLLIFIVQNLGSTEVKFLFFKFSMPLIVLIILVFLIGLLTSRAFSRKKTPAKEESVEKSVEKPAEKQ